MNLNIVILAAGNGKRMRSNLPKVLHPVAGVSLLERVIKVAQSLNPKAVFVVYGNDGNQVREALSQLNVHWIKQPEPRGTGHALLQAVPHVPDNERILVLYGDVPLITRITLANFLESFPSESLGLLITELENPMGFGRIIRDEQNKIVAIVEQKDASPLQKQIKEINTGIMTASSDAFKRWLPQLTNKNTQNEYYLTDIVELAVKENIEVIARKIMDPHEVRGVNNRQELAELERVHQRQITEQLLQNGVTFYDPLRFDCRGELDIAEDVTIDIDVIMEGKVTIGSGSLIGPFTHLKNVEIGKNVIIKSHCVIEDAVIADDCLIGPFARIRPKTELDKNVHIGNFVELKNTQMGMNSKANHLSYLGDAKIGVDVNVGAGTITCNYDGTNKHQTIIKDQAFIGSGTELVAPVTIGESAYIGAGSTITRDAPDHELTLARAKQATIKGWKRNKQNKK